MESKTGAAGPQHMILLPPSLHRICGNEGRVCRGVVAAIPRTHRQPAGPTAAGVPGVTTPPRRWGNHTPYTPEVAAPKTRLARSHAHATGRRLPAHARRPGPASLPTDSAERRPPASTSPVPSPAQPPPVGGSIPLNSPTREGAPSPHCSTPGGSSGRTAHLARGLLPRSRPTEPGWGLRGSAGRRAAGSEGKERRGRGSGYREPPPFSSADRGSRSQAGRPRTLAQFLTASRPVSLSLTPLPHTLTPTHSHPAAPRSLTRLPRARARPRSHTARATPAETAQLPETERRPPACRGPARAPAPPSWRGGAAGGGRRPEELGAGPARRALPSGSDTCVETRPPSSSPAPEPSLASGEERRWIARGERKGSARALRGRASPPAPKPSSLRKGNGWGVGARFVPNSKPRD